MSTAHSCTTATPAGPFTTIVAADGAVLASGWTGSADDLLPLISASLRPAELRERRDVGAVTRAVAAYHSGDVRAVDDVVVRQRGGAFTGRAWEVLRTVPPGRPVSYAAFAALAGRPAAVRAAATACASNAAALFVPCHRVVRTGGATGNFRWGVPVKRWLLAHETPAG
ncbi:methylated-DNA--[protein]-cysteine S-methyltransferase [Umezawaea beigongshangensis]|uniref:methylated-DNA--[protein]-cysteine S-methyltransferase n=1 Tax=Umezawaea beigongshangensis TaxID=2780383 RepID=UPI0018F25BAB|nr:methylated-DNA--[protein]-cysteine S-methyltransferase [Umezawaea beigongshangensis]